MNRAPRSTAAFDDLIAALTEIRDGYALSEARGFDELDTAEAYRYVLQMVSVASELLVEGDPDHPRFARIVWPARKLQGDNPDAIYHYARVSGSHTYRISGRIQRECYTSFTVHGRAADGGMAGPLLGDVNDRDFHVADDGSYELVLGGEPRLGNWRALHPDAYCIVVRSYYMLERSAQNDPSVAVDIDIETLDVVTAPPPLNDELLASRLNEATAFLRQVTVGQQVFGTSSGVPFVAELPNTLPVPFSFRDSGLPVPGAADIWYSMGRFQLADGEALVITGTLPRCAFVNVMLWNKHMQTLEYRNRTSSLNQAQLELETDGSFRIVVSSTDPGVPNWLDSEGHLDGTVFWRFLLPEEDPGPFGCEVVPVGSLRRPD